MGYAHKCCAFVDAAQQNRREAPVLCRFCSAQVKTSARSADVLKMRLLSGAFLDNLLLLIWGCALAVALLSALPAHARPVSGETLSRFAVMLFLEASAYRLALAYEKPIALQLALLALAFVGSTTWAGRSPRSLDTLMEALTLSLLAFACLVPLLPLARAAWALIRPVGPYQRGLLVKQKQ